MDLDASPLETQTSYASFDVAEDGAETQKILFYNKSAG